MNILIVIWRTCSLIIYICTCATDWLLKHDHMIESCIIMFGFCGASEEKHNYFAHSTGQFIFYFFLLFFPNLFLFFVFCFLFFFGGCNLCFILFLHCLKHISKLHAHIYYLKRLTSTWSYTCVHMCIQIKRQKTSTCSSYRTMCMCIIYVHM